MGAKVRRKNDSHKCYNIFFAFSNDFFTGNPYPESATLTLSFALKSYLTSASLGYALADGESQTGALHEVVELIEAVEDT